MKARAYVDGSFNPALGRYAFGLLCLHGDGAEEEYCGSGDSADALAQRNVSGEMIAAMLAVKWALINGYDELEILYDYVGIEAWVTGAWKAKNDLTRKYADAMRKWQERVKLTFTKVAAHTGDEKNERADRLAKQGLEQPVGLPQILPRKTTV